MFEDVVQKRDPITVIFYCGLAPFALAWWIHNSLTTGFLLEAYLISIAVFVIGPFEVRKQDSKERWFWNTMLRAGAVTHPLLLVGLWFLDATHPTFVAGTGTIFLVAFVVSMAETVLLGETVKRFRPADERGR